MVHLYNQIVCSLELSPVLGDSNHTGREKEKELYKFVVLLVNSPKIHYCMNTKKKKSIPPYLTRPVFSSRFIVFVRPVWLSNKTN